MAQEETDKLEIPITMVQWGLRGTQVFFSFLSMACIAAVISFDNKFMSSSIISVVHIFFIVTTMLVSVAIIAIPYVYQTYGKFKNAARALKVVRIEFVLSAICAILIFLVSLAMSVELGLRNCDPYSPKWEIYRNRSEQSNSTFTGGLASNCRTARAGNAFGWFALSAWLFSLAVIAKDWYDNRRQPYQKQDPHRDEITMHSTSSRSSFEVSTENNPYRPQQYQEQTPVQHMHSQTGQPTYVEYTPPQPTYVEYSQQGLPQIHQQSPNYGSPHLVHTPVPGIPSQHASPIIHPSGMPMPDQMPPGSIGPPGFPQPQHYQQ